MNYLRQQVVAKDLSEEKLKQKLLLADVCISDLDHTDTLISPAEDLAKLGIGVNSTPFGYLKYLAWASCTGLNLISAFSSPQFEQALERVKEQQFDSYNRQFLRKPAVKKWENSKTALKEEVTGDIASLLTDKYVALSLFPGVKEFYQAFPGQKRYLSRNIFPMVKAYADFLDFNGFDYDVNDKAIMLEELISNHPWKRMILRVDGVAEKEMINVAKCYQHQKSSSLEDVLVIKRSLNLEDSFKHCDILVGYNDYGLVDIMKDRTPRYGGTATDFGER